MSFPLSEFWAVLFFDPLFAQVIGNNDGDDDDDEQPKEMMMVSVDAKKDKQGQGWWLHPILLQCGGSKTVRATKLDGSANSSQPNYFGAYVLH